LDTYGPCGRGRLRQEQAARAASRAETPRARTRQVQRDQILQTDPSPPLPAADHVAAVFRACWAGPGAP